MIVTLTRYMTRLALRIRNSNNSDQLTDWQNLQLVIAPMPPQKGCHVGGSPWFLHGCWPFHPTDVDLANPRLPDFPAIVMDAFETDAEGRVVFLMDRRVHELPNGRYLGTVRAHAHTPPINLPTAQKPAAWEPMGAATHYDADHVRVPCDPVAPIFSPHAPACDLYTFEIDLGPECAQHIVDQAVVDLARSDCGDDGEFCKSC